VGFRRSGIHRYRLNESNMVIKVQEIMSPSAPVTAVSCAAWINHELWVGVGSHVAVFDATKDYELCVKQTIFNHKFQVSAIWGHGDRVWLRESRGAASVIVELDVSSRSIVCVLDFSREVSVDECIASSDYNGAAEIQNQSAVRNDGNSKPKLTMHLSDEGQTNRTLHRKRTSCKKRQLRHIVKNRDADRQYITSAAYVDGLLWVGSTSGEIVIVNVTENNCFGYLYGQVLAKLCPITNEPCGLVYEIVCNGSYVLTVHEQVSESRSSWKLIKWTSLGLDAVHLCRSLWESIPFI
jgi:hypothetical protein